MIIIVENHEEGLKLSTEAITDNLVDPSPVLIGEHCRKGRNGLDEVVGAETQTR